MFILVYVPIDVFHGNVFVMTLVQSQKYPVHKVIILEYKCMRFFCDTEGTVFMCAFQNAVMHV